MFSHICLDLEFAYLQPHRRVRLHDMAHILHQLAHGASDFLCANADNHALGCAIILTHHLLVRRRLLLALTAPA
jgi:hypothetical protein